MIEWVAIAISSSVAVTGFLSWWNTRQSNNRMNEQLESQNKIASANLVFKLLENWNGDNAFTQMIYKLEKPNAEFIDEDDGVHFVLATFEDIAILRKDKTLTETHVREFFGRDIVRIDANESVMKILNNYRQEDIEHNYNHLKDMLDDSKKCGIEPYSSNKSSSVVS